MLDTLLACEFVDFYSLDIEDEAIPLLAIAGGVLFLLVTVAVHALRNITLGRAREASRREIAAYVAEGSMSAEEGERLLNAGRPHWQRWH